MVPRRCSELIICPNGNSPEEETTVTGPLSMPRMTHEWIWRVGDIGGTSNTTRPNSSKYTLTQSHGVYPHSHMDCLEIESGLSPWVAGNKSHGPWHGLAEYDFISQSALLHKHRQAYCIVRYCGCVCAGLRVVEFV